MKHKQLIFLLTVAAIFALSNFTSNPGFWFDEGIIAGVGKSLAQNGVYGTMVAPGQFMTQNFWITTNFPLTLPVALSIKLFGVGVWQARLAPFLYLLLFVAAAYFLVVRLFGARSAFWSTALLITFAPLYGNGKAVLGEVPGLFWFIFSLYCYLRFADTKKSLWLLSTALAAGLAIVTKPFYALLVPGLGYLFINGIRSGLINRRQICLAVIAILLPFLAWLGLTIGWQGIIHLSATLSYFTNSYAADSFSPSVKANLWRFFSESTPLHFTFLSIILLVVAWRAWRERSVESNIIRTILIFGALAWLWYLKTPGWYRYFFSIHLVVLIFFPAAAKKLFGQWSTIVLFFLVLFQGGHLLYNYNTFTSHQAINAAAYIDANLPAAASVFVVSHPEITYLLRRQNVAQFIFINKKLTIGATLSAVNPPDFIVASDDDVSFLNEFKSWLDTNYNQQNIFGHYLFFSHK